MSTDILKNRDLEYDDLERNELLSGEPRYQEDEVRNSTFSIMFGALAGIFCLAAMILCWILYWRERTRTFLWHAIWLICAMLFGFMCAAWAVGAGTAVKSHKQPSSMFTLLIFLGSLVFMVYLFAEVMWLIFYRPIHFSYLAGLKTNNDLWNYRMTSGSSFDEGWTSSRRMIWWVTFFTLAAGVCFTFCAYASRTVVWNRFQLSRIGLYAACLFMVLSGLMVIYWSTQCNLYIGLNKDSFTSSLVFILKVLGYIAIVAGVVNAIVNLLKFKFAYFFMGIFFIILAIVLVSCTGSLWREIRVSQRDRLSNSCSENLVPIHENELAKVCVNGGKYLAPGDSCTKEFLVNRWEGGNSGTELRSLNPGCCELGKSFYYLPFMYLAFWATVLTLCVSVALSCNFYLADTSEYLSNANKPTGIIDYIGLALIFALLIGWILFFIFRDTPGIEYGTNSAARSYNSPDDNKINGFDIVPRNILSNANPPINSNGCQKYNTNTMVKPTFSTTDPTCTTNCIERLALLTRNGKIVPPTDMAGANLGSDSSRLTFFPGCTDSTQSYILLYGNNQQLLAALNTLTLCPTILSQAPEVFIYHDQVPANSIGNNGLKSGEDGYSQLSNADGAGCGSGYSSATPTCNGKCTIDYTTPVNYGLTNLKGALYYIDNGVTKYDVHPDVIVSATANGNKIGSSNTLFSGGIFTISNIPRFSDNEYYITLNIKDNKGVFLTKNIDVKVPKTSPIPDEVSAGKIQLITADGKVCLPTDATCLNAQKRLTGAVLVTVKDTTDAASNTPLDGALISINSGHTLNGATVKTTSTDSTGTAKAADLSYDAYTLVASKNGYLPMARRVDLQVPTFSVLNFYLRPTTSDDDMRVVADMNEPSADFDLNMKVRSDKGAACQVSPFNKYCAYSAHLNDVSSGNGQEVISVKRLSVAEYLPFIAPAAPYQGTCSAADTIADAKTHYQQGWDWSKYKLTRPIELANIVVSTIGGKFSGDSDLRSAITEAIPKLFPVETKEQSQVDKFILNRGGVVSAPGSQLKSNTDVTASSTISDSNLVITSKNSTTTQLPNNAGSSVITNISYTMNKDTVKQFGTNVTNTTAFTNGSKLADQNNEIHTAAANGTTTDGWEDTSNLVNPDGSTIAEVDTYKFTQGSGVKEYRVTSNDYITKLGDSVSLNHTEKNSSIFQEFSKQNTTTTTMNHDETYKSNSSRLVTYKQAFNSPSADIDNTAEDFIVKLFHKTADDTEFESHKTAVTRKASGAGATTTSSITNVVIYKSNGTRKSTTDAISSNSDASTGTSTVKNSTIILRNTDSSSEEVVNIDSSQINNGLNRSINLATRAVNKADGSQWSNSKIRTISVQNGVNTTEDSFIEKNFPTKGVLGTAISNNSVTTLDSASPASSSFVSTFKQTDIFTTNATVKYTLVTENSILPTDGTSANTRQILTQVYLNYSANSTNVTYTYNTKGTYDPTGKTAPSLTTNTWSVLVYDYKKGTQTEYRSDSPTPIVTAGPILVKRLLALASAHAQGGTGNNFMVVNCFTGFGKVSVVEQGKFTVSEPTFDDCIPVLNLNLPQYTMAKLRQQVGN